MGRRQFAFSYRWSWDHSNDEIATFTIEGDEEEENPEIPIFTGKPLTIENAPLYLAKHRDTITNIVYEIAIGVNGNPMGAGPKLCAIFEIRPYSHDQLNIIHGEKLLVLTPITSEPLFTFDANNTVIVNS